MKRQERHDTVPSHEKYDEYKLLPQAWAWILLFGFSASLIAWALWLHMIVPERPAHWYHGAVPFTPAESIYSTVEIPDDMKAIRQIEALPEAEPLEETAAGGKGRR